MSSRTIAVLAGWLVFVFLVSLLIGTTLGIGAQIVWIIPTLVGSWFIGKKCAQLDRADRHRG